MLHFQLDENQVEHIDGMTVEYPYCMHRRDLTNFAIPWHWHEELELGYLETGTSIISTIHAEYTIHQGDGFFINTNVMCAKRNAVPGNPALEINHLFHPVLLGGHFKSLFETKYLQPVLKNRQIEVHILRHGSPTGHEILKHLIRLKELQQRENVEFQTRNLLSETWLLLLEELERHAETVSPSETESRLRQMLVLIHSRYAEKLTLEQIAASANISEREALRCFQSSLHQSPIAYLISYRLHIAQKLLLETEYSMTEIAGRCGFSDASYFSKTFRSAVGLSPLEYRRTRRTAGAEY